MPLSGDAGTGPCGWERDGRNTACAAHRRRRWLTGSYQGHIPVVRKPSRRPDAVAARRLETAARLAEALQRQAEQDAAYLAQVEQRDRTLRAAKRVTAALA